jgi:hypothetical protein
LIEPANAGKIADFIALERFMPPKSFSKTDKLISE